MCGCAVSPVLLTAIAFPGPSTAPRVPPPITAHSRAGPGAVPAPQPQAAPALSPPGRQRDPAKGGGGAASQPSIRPLLLGGPRGSCPGPRRSRPWRLPLSLLVGEHVPFPRLPTGDFSSLQKSTHLLRRQREGRNWLPAAVQGTRPAAGERRAPPAPARQHGLGRRRLLLVPWACSGVITAATSDFPP